MPTPMFETIIPTDGPLGNINVILGTATRLMKEIGVPTDARSRLVMQVQHAKSYDEAKNFVREWFPLDDAE